MRSIAFGSRALGAAVTAALSVSTLGAQASTAEVYTVDIAHSILDFTVRLAGFNRTRGSFQRWSADLVYDPVTPANSSVSFIASVASIATGESERDDDLRGPQFFDVGKYPFMRFRSDRVVPDSGGFLVEGQLTIKDVSRSVRLPVHIVAPLGRDPFNNLRIAFGTTLTINRRDFNVVGPRFWNEAISDSVTIEMEIPGRIWNYASLDWGPPTRRSVGKYLYTAADSGKLQPALRTVRQWYATPSRDSTWWFGPRQFEYAAMQLVQSPRPRFAEARQVLELALELLATMSPGERSNILTRLGEVSCRQGDQTHAREVLQQALALDHDNTNAAEWLRLAELPR
jgi:polyisoprenoid-binding protein YceI